MIVRVSLVWRSPRPPTFTVRRAYKTKALETHPDKLDPDANEKDKEISEARFRQVSHPDLWLATI